MSAAIPTSSSSQAAQPASPLPEIQIHRDPDPDPTPAAVAPSVVVAETKPDESKTSPPPALRRPQNPAQPPDPQDLPVRVESHAPDPAPARPQAEGERTLPAVPANVALSPRVQASLRLRVASDSGNENAHRPVRRFEPPPVQRLDLPGSGYYRQRPATYTGEFESQDGWAQARVMSPSQSIDYPPGSVGSRLYPTLEEAVKVRDTASLQAKWTIYSINIAIAFQVVLGALTTTLGASLQGNSSRISIAVLGSLSTLVASYLARTRGTSEPESSLLREQALSNFIRKLRAFILDCGTQEGHDNAVENFRKELERLLNASDPNTKKPPLFDPELKFDDDALGLMGLNQEGFRELKRTQKRQTHTATGATGATGAR
ncbi:hypothetical protein BJY52DRAFT_1188258 [Lactarius psammicola]|nr:hypothetical protein BJY52DRAFT_1188258 [Lactarius psammicola]